MKAVIPYEWKEFAKNMIALLTVIAEAGGTDLEAATAALPKTKKKPAVIEEDFLGEESEDDETRELEAEQKPAKKGAKKELKVEDVIEALQAYCAENDRKAGMKLLAKFKVKSVHDLDEADYPKILKLMEG